MIRDLPKNLPSVVSEAAKDALDGATGRIRRAREVGIAYRGEAYRRHRNRAMGRPDDALERQRKAVAIVKWTSTLRGALPCEELHRTFKTKEDPEPYLLAASGEIALTASDGFPGGTLKSELRLVLDPESACFRFYDWLDGVHVNSAPLLISPYDLVGQMHPLMIDLLHESIAEGLNLPLIVDDLARLVRSRTDR